jgi:DNA polymerase-3 subunit gamma/tau
MLSEIIKAETDIRNASSPRLALEMALIRASFLSSIKPLKEVIENINKHGKQSGGSLAPALPERLPAVGEADERTAVSSEIRPREERTEGVSTKVAQEREKDEHIESQIERQAGGQAMDIRAIWEKTITRIEQPTLSSVLQQSGIELKGNELCMTLEGGQALVFEDSVKKNIKRLEKIVSEEAGREIKIRLVTANKKRVPMRDLRETVREAPLIREALELFEGRIVDVTPMGNSENTDNGGEDV